MASQMSGSDHGPHHPDVSVQCPVSCLGIRTVGDLIALLADTARRGFPDKPPGLPPNFLPHEEHTLTCPVSCLRLSARITSAVRAHDGDVQNIGQLIYLLQSGELWEVRNIGHRSVGEVHAALVAEGFDVSFPHPT